ncbi:MAG: sulfotransferase [Phycisphaerae bacterium]|nr:sulfotransferase [Phycisphaerae bacterium]
MKASAVLDSPLASDAPAGPLPSFFVIGARKCGTTTLDQYMRQHPQICLPRGKKELNFFGDQAHRGLAWYRAHFAHARADQLCGEVAPMYSIEQDPPCARRIAELVPQARLVYIVRHPVERTYSDFCEQIKTARALGRNCAWFKSFDDFLDADPRAVRASEYIRTIEEYQAYFPPEALLTVLFDDLKADSTALLRRIYAHIGVNSGAAAATDRPIRANAGDEYLQWQTRLRLTRTLRALPGVATAAQFIPRSWRDWAYTILERSRFGQAVRAALAPPPMSAQTRQRLLERFRAPNRALAAYLGRDLSHWDR